MGRRNKSYSKDLHQQAFNRLTEMLEKGTGTSKWAEKKIGDISDKIYSYSTYQSYWKCTKQYLSWLKKEHPDCSTLKSARKYVPEYMQSRVNYIKSNGRHLSAWTLQLENCALGKLFQIKPDDPLHFECPRRNRWDITRSRLNTISDKHFSVSNNKELIEFCRGTGCRRNILEKLEGRDLWTRNQMEAKVKELETKASLSDKEYRHLDTLKDALQVFPDKQHFIHHRRDKGGRDRFAPIIGPHQDKIIERFQKTRDGKKVWEYVPKAADIHSYRADYCLDLYKEYTREIKDIPYDKYNPKLGRWYQSDVYTCRKDEKGKKLDRQAMQKCSKALGHNRPEVVATYYIRGL